MNDLTLVIEALVGLAAALAAVFLIPLLVRKYGAEKTSRLAYWVSAAVKAAEQIYSDFTKAGQEKKDYVITFLHKLGLMYNEDEVDALIESEVLKLNAEKKNRV